MERKKPEAEFNYLFYGFTLKEHKLLDFECKVLKILMSERLTK